MHNNTKYPKDTLPLLGVAIFALALAGMALLIAPASASAATVYTVNADFDKGSLINVIHTPSDQLQLTDQVNTFNFIWVAVSTKGTAVKINTDTGAIVGEYRTTPTSHGNGDPSRTTVDKDGSVWLSNRSDVFQEAGSVVHIGLVENGQCEDRNGNGVIDTSTAQDDIKTWSDASGARNVSTAADECIVHYVKIPTSHGTRHISVDGNNNIWVAGYYSRNFDLIKGGKWNVPNSGTIIRSETSVGYGGYGGLIDKNGVIWSANGLLRWDTANPLTGPNGGNWTGYGHNSYGLCIDSQGNVWNTALSGGQIRKFAPNGTLLGTFTHGYSYAQGCVADKNDHIWIAHSILGSGASVGHILNDGTYIGSVSVGSGPTGVAVDANGKIWATNYYTGTVSRINPNSGSVGADAVTKIGEVDFTTPNLGGNPYNYSDMTGSTLSGKAGSGTWSVVQDSQVSGTIGKIISWSADVPSDGSLTVSVATSEDGITFGSPQTVTNGQDISGMAARFHKISVSFERGARGVSPILYDLSLSTPICGDSIVNQSSEQCDAGANGSSTCSTTCTTITPAPTPVPTPVVQADSKPVLSIAKSVNLKSVTSGDKVTYTVTVRNIGTTKAVNVVLTDVLPKGFAFDDKSLTKKWMFGDLEPGANITRTYVVKVDTAMSAGKYTNSATVVADGMSAVSAQAIVEVKEGKVLGEETVVSSPTTLPSTGTDIFASIISGVTLIGSGLLLKKRII